MSEDRSARGVAARVAVLALACLAPAARAQAPGAQRALPETTTVILLGTGTPSPLARAQGPATAVVAGGRLFVFDAGPGVMRQMEAAGLPYRKGPVTALFLTHLHSDHTLGYPDLLFTSWVMGRAAPLRVIGPPGTKRMTEHLVEAWREDIDVRTNGLEHGIPGGWRADVRETKGGVVYDSAGVTIRAIRVSHGNWEYAFAYRIDAPGKTIVISGDTSPCEAVEQAARGVDVLVHEVYPEARLAPENRPGGDDWPKYMRAFHTSDRELGALAARAGPRTLVLYHVVRMGGTDEELLAGVRAGGYGGNVVIGHDLDRY
jgi:ribonuclease BN (tRNA processing enzyme)